MTLLNPWALIFIPIAFWLFKSFFRLQSTHNHTDFLQEHKRYTSQTKMIFFALVFALLGLSRPVITNEITQEKFEANEYIIALDASYSMLANDLKPNRYEVAKKTIIHLLKLDMSDRFTLFAFTRNPLLLSPPTTDTEIIISALNALSPEFILTKSTSLESLLQEVSQLDQEHKSLIVFTDGGDEHNLQRLLSIASQSAMTLNIVAVASKKGAVLKRGGEVLKDKNAHLIVSRINPILRNLASETGGFYFELNDAKESIASQIFNKLKEQNSHAEELSTEVVSYKELYFLPLGISFVILLVALTQAQKFLPLLVVSFFLYPHYQADASLFDFYYNKEAKEDYHNKRYSEAIENFKKLAPSQYSYMSLANAYYKNGQYKSALRYYAKIKSQDATIKSIVFYNMANAAYQLKKYKRAEKFYQQSLALSFSKEAKENLFLLYSAQLKSKIDVADMLPHVNDKEVTSVTQKSEHKKEDEKKNSSSHSEQKATQGSEGGSGAQKKKSDKQQVKSEIKGNKNEYKMGYNAYELINKGYINETKPW